MISDVNGWITGARYWKRTTATGVHTATLWTSGGAMVAQATFVNETASGWQEVTFSTPVPISANVVYVMTYHAPNGQYAVTQNAFGSQVDNGVLHVPASGTVGGNGVYAYSGTTTFPTNSFRDTNYWVDVVFTTSPP